MFDRVTDVAPVGEPVLKFPTRRRQATLESRWPLGITLSSVLSRLESFGENLQERIQSEEYLALVRQGFRSWDRAETEEKREFIRKLLENAGGTNSVPTI